MPSNRLKISKGTVEIKKKKKRQKERNKQSWGQKT